MSKNNLPVLIAIIALFAIDGSANSQETEDGGANRGERHKQMHRDRGERGSMDAQRMIQGMARRLDLDDTQVEQMTNIVESARPEMESLRENGRENRKAMRELDVTDPDYGAKLQNLAAAKGELEVSSTELRGRLRADMHAILTPEQQQKMAEFRPNDRHRGRGNRNREQAQ